MTEISDVLRDNAGTLWNVSANTGGELLIEQGTPANEWTEATLTEASYTEPTYVEASYTEPTYVEASYTEPTYVESTWTDESY